MARLISTVAGSRGGLQSGTTSTVKLAVANVLDDDEDIIISLTVDLVPIDHGSSSHHESRQQQPQPWTGPPSSDAGDRTGPMRELRKTMFVTAMM